MDIKDLRAFLTLADTLHFAKASQLCHISPSALSRQIQRLEEQVGYRLFDRDNRHVSLTLQGVKFSEYARDSLHRWHQFEQSLDVEGRELHGILRLYCSVTASAHFLSGTLQKVRQFHPGIELRLHTGDEALSTERVLAGDEDIAIAARPDRLPSSLIFHTISRSALVLIAPAFPCPVADLVEHLPDRWGNLPVILSEQGLSRRYAEEWFTAQGAACSLYAEVAGHEAIVSMVGLGLGIGVVPEVVLEHSSIRDSVRVIETQNPFRAYNIGLCVRESGLDDPVVRAFWNCATDQLG